MRHLSFILGLFTFVQIVCAQKHEWSSPFVGYSTTKVLTLDKVEFDKNGTLLHVTAIAASGSSISVSPDTYLSANGKRYALRKVSVLGIGKQYKMPDSGKVHFIMQFGALPTDTRLMHFSEGEVETGWTLCNIREPISAMTPPTFMSRFSIMYQRLAPHWKSLTLRMMWIKGIIQENTT